MGELRGRPECVNGLLGVCGKGKGATPVILNADGEVGGAEG